MLRSEQPISRILFPVRVTPAGQRSFICGCRLPDTSCDLPGSLGGPPSNAPLFGLAPGGVCIASPVTRGTGALLPHRFTLTRKQTNPFDSGRYTFCCTFLRVTATPRYGAPCPVVFGLSSGFIINPAIVWPTPTVFFRLSSKSFGHRSDIFSNCHRVAIHCTSEEEYSYDSPGMRHL